MQRITALIVLLVIGSSTSAAPGTNTSYLMNEPASVFDVGILKLNSFLRFIQEKTRFGESIDAPYVVYSYDDDKIIFTSVLIGTKYKKNSQLEDTCTDIINSLREKLSVSKIDAKPMYQQEHSSLLSYFSHEGYEHTASPAPKDLASTLDNMAELQGEVFTEDSSNQKAEWAVTCKSALLSTDIFFSKQK